MYVTVGQIGCVLVLAYLTSWYFRATAKPANWQPPGWATWGMAGKPISRDSFRLRMLVGMLPIGFMLIMSVVLSR